MDSRCPRRANLPAGSRSYAPSATFFDTRPPIAPDIYVWCGGGRPMRSRQVDRSDQRCGELRMNADERVDSTGPRPARRRRPSSLLQIAATLPSVDAGLDRLIARANKAAVDG